jgi:hypothetical protein
MEITKNKRLGKLRTLFKGNYGWWLCICDCGKRRYFSEQQLRTARDCGPGHALTPLQYKQLCNIWNGIMARCTKAHNAGYRNYGGRGITVCKRWHNREVFLTDILASIGPRPPGRSIDRIDNDKGYFPGNVRWATPQEQIANSRNPYIPANMRH